MPSCPNGICLDCRSKATIGSKYCANHQVNNQRRQTRITYDEMRSDDDLRQLYRSNRWKAVRKVVFRRDNYLCRSCGHKAATEVDHTPRARIIVDEFGVDEFFNVDRLMALCHGCHSQKTRHELGFTKGGTNLTSTTIGNRSQFTVVCGPAGSGKTYYVATHKADDDKVWDYDVVMAEITGLPIHEGLEGAVGSVLAHRDTWIRATEHCKHHCWLIVSNPKAVIVGMMRDAGANVVVMDTPDDVCQQRLRDRFIADNELPRLSPPI